MTPQFGDIVVIPARADNQRWVMSPSASPSHNHVPNIRLLRHGYGVWISFTTKINDVQTVERPTFGIGERVTVNDRAGVIIALGDDFARVRWDARSLPLKGGGAIRDEGGETDVELWLLALDNRLTAYERTLI